MILGPIPVLTYCCKGAEVPEKNLQNRSGTTKTVGDFAENACVGGLSADVKQEPDTEDDDPVIHEIPVYLSKSIPKLYLFQVSVLTSHKT